MTTIDLMANDPEQKEKCPLKFWFMTHGYGYLVHSGKSDGGTCLGASEKETLIKKCSSESGCDYTKCDYHKELIRALEATKIIPPPRYSI